MLAENADYLNQKVVFFPFFPAIIDTDQFLSFNLGHTNFPMDQGQRAHRACSRLWLHTSIGISIQICRSSPNNYVSQMESQASVRCWPSQFVTQVTTFC